MEVLPPMRHSLISRMLALCVLVAVCSIAATAWIAVRTATKGIRQQQAQVLADDSRIYDTLMTFGATHPGWDHIGPTITALERVTARHIVLVTDPGAQRPAGLPSRVSAVINPLSTDPTLMPGPGGRIDTDAVGPFQLTRTERDLLQSRAAQIMRCLAASDSAARIVVGPSGRPVIKGALTSDYDSCGGRSLSRPTATEHTALRALDQLVNRCIGRAGLNPVRLSITFGWTQSAAEPQVADGNQPVQACITAARKQQLRPYVAAAAQLYVTNRGGADPRLFNLSPGNEIRIAAAAVGILLLTIAVTVLASMRLTRPLRALTGAAQRMTVGESRAHLPVRGTDEIARLTGAFNEMSAALARNEELRKRTTNDIAHELRTPLSNIRGWLEATQDGLSQPDPALIASLLEEAMLLQHIVDDLQDLAMAEAGRLQLHPEPVAVAELLAQVQQAQRPAAAAAGVTLTADAPGGLMLTADPLRVRQALTNLVSNAIRYTPAGGAVTISGRAEAGDVVLAVADTGAGIRAEDLPHVFERFWRAEKSRPRDGGGSGLGLAITRRLALAHHGSVSAVSTPGLGSTFTLSLPAAP